MAEFTLPANSKVKIGNTHIGPEDAVDIRAFKVYRYFLLYTSPSPRDS